MNPFKKIKPVFSYLIHAKTRHGIHSPFVYHLFDEIICDFKKRKEYSEVEKYRTELLKNHQKIERTDFGAGVSATGKTKKKISEIARLSTKEKLYGRLLFRLAYYFQPENIVELGTCFGIGTLYLSKACPNAQVYTLEGCPETAEIARMIFERENVSKVQIIEGTFNESLPKLAKQIQKVGLGYVDGNHRKQPTLDYFRFFLSFISEESILIFDDIHWSGEMEEAWKELINHEKVTISIDLYQFGILFFRKGLPKQHFRLRFPV